MHDGCSVSQLYDGRRHALYYINELPVVWQTTAVVWNVCATKIFSATTV